MKRYECFSYFLMKFLMQNNQIPISIDVHKKTKRTFWTFEMNDELSRLLKIWTNKENLK